MRKALTYTSLSFASLLVILVFITAKTYTQLSIAILLYVPLAYLILEFFPRKYLENVPATEELPKKPSTQAAAKIENTEKEEVVVSDINKRTFLKFVGATGLSFLLYSLFGKRVESLLIGRVVDSNLIPPANNALLSSSPAMDGYKVSEIDDGIITYYGFTNKDEGWLIMMEDTNTNSYRYSKGDSDFPSNWANRKEMKYDYFYNIF